MVVNKKLISLVALSLLILGCAQTVPSQPIPETNTLPATLQTTISEPSPQILPLPVEPPISSIRTAPVSSTRIMPDQVPETTFNLLKPVKKGKPQNVFLVVMDGVRYSETFGDPDRRYIPHLWYDLRPLGTINSKFYNNGLTVTVPGHTSMLTGIRQKIRNDGTERPHNPTIFEYFRQQKNTPASKTWVITPHMNMFSTNYSDVKSFGEAFGAKLDSPVLHWQTPPPVNADMGELVRTGDEAVFDILKHVMNRDKPNLTLVNFGQTDIQGHLGSWRGYTQAIENADRLTYFLWLEIQRNPYYKDKTTMIVTNDHGRHLDDVATGFQDHGGTDEGCRRVMFLAMGPDINVGKVIDTPRELIDIGPTVGSMLDIKMPQVQGRVMEGLFR